LTLVESSTTDTQFSASCGHWRTDSISEPHWDASPHLLQVLGPNSPVHPIETELGFLPGLDEAHSREFFQVVGDRRPGYSGLVGKRRARYLGFPGNALENLHPPRLRERTPDSIELLLIHDGLQVA